jgi:hypothetical protein
VLIINIYDWIPALTSSSLLALALWLLRKLISTRLTQSVKNEFDSKLEDLKSELRQKEDQIKSLQQGALSGLVSRQSKMYEKRIEAIEQIWEAKSQLSKGVHLVHSMALLKFEISSEESVKNPNFRAFMETIGGNLELSDFNLESAKKCRPFISDLAWAYYSAYQTIIFHAYIKMDVLRKGIDNPEKYINFEGSDKLLKTTLPHYAALIEEHGDAVHHHFLEEIEKLLLSELRNIQLGHDSDMENTKKAAAIIREADEILKSTNKGAGKA